jgi:hypothetical protein
VDFAPLAKGHLPQSLVKGHRQVNAAVNDPGPPRLLPGFAGPLEVGGGVRLRLTMKMLPVGFLALTRAFYRSWAEFALRWP